jgi:Acetyl-coenzyme A synthetase N-terminus
MHCATVLSQEHASSLEATDEYWAKEARELLHWHRDFDRTSHVSTLMLYDTYVDVPVPSCDV